MDVLIRCDGDYEIGLGHVVRCLALADELTGQGCRVSFAMRVGALGVMRVEPRYSVLQPDQGGPAFDYEAWLRGCLEQTAARVLILDSRDGLPRAVVERLRDRGTLIVTIDDPEEKRLATDLAFYPPVPQVKEVDWSGFTGTLYTGWEYVILRKEFAAAHERPRNKIPKVLVTMGGSDPAGLTLKALKALKRVKGPLHIYIVIGGGFRQRKELNTLSKDTGHDFKILENVQDMAALMAECDLAVASFGATAYELAAVGVPAVLLSLSKDHERSAQAFVDAQIVESIGLYWKVPVNLISKSVGYLLNDQRKRESMTKRAINLMIGQGSKRVSEIIAQNISK